MQITTAALDLAKNVFQEHAIDTAMVGASCVFGNNRRKPVMITSGGDGATLPTT